MVTLRRNSYFLGMFMYKIHHVEKVNAKNLNQFETRGYNEGDKIKHDDKNPTTQEEEVNTSSYQQMCRGYLMICFNEVIKRLFRIQNSENTFQVLPFS